MTVIKYKSACDLCGLNVDIDDFNVLTTEGKKKFCCAGCLSVYQLLNPDKLIYNNNEETFTNEDKKP